MSRAVKPSRRIALETLENRCLMAGDVAVALEGSFLRIEGDNLANQIAISQTATGDVIIAGQTGTRVNGLPSVRLVRPQINAVDLRMNGGNDSVTVRSLRTANDLFVDLGAGDDRLVLPAGSNVQVGANASIYGEAGNDVLQLNGLTVREDLFVDGGLGVLNAQLAAVNVDKALIIVADEANDVVSLTGVRVGENASIESKGGSDRVVLTDVNAFAINVNTDANSALGADSLSMLRVRTREDLVISTGDGADVVTLTDVTSGKSALVSLDNGNDRLVATRVAAATDAVFEGGAGVDFLQALSVTGGIKREFKEFETIR